MRVSTIASQSIRPRALRLLAEEDVLGHGHLGDERQLLVDDGDARAPRRPGALNETGLPVEHELAFVAAVRVDAGQHLDQRGLAGAVLAAERVDLAGAQIEGHVASAR